MQDGDDNRWKSRLIQHAGRIVPRVLIILLVFLGLNWWAKNRQQQASQQTAVTQSLDDAWDKHLHRRPGVAVAIVWDRQLPTNVSAEAFNSWEQSARGALEQAYTAMTRFGHEQSQLPLRAGVFITLPMNSQLQPAIKSELTSPSIGELEELFQSSQWHGHGASHEQTLTQAMKMLSYAGLDHSTLIVMRHPLLEKEQSTSRHIGQSLPPPPDGPRIVLLSPSGEAGQLPENMAKLMQSILGSVTAVQQAVPSQP